MSRLWNARCSRRNFELAPAAASLPALSTSSSMALCTSPTSAVMRGNPNCSMRELRYQDAVPSQLPLNQPLMCRNTSSAFLLWRMVLRMVKVLKVLKVFICKCPHWFKCASCVVLVTLETYSLFHPASMAATRSTRLGGFSAGSLLLSQGSQAMDALVSLPGSGGRMPLTSIY